MISFRFYTPTKTNKARTSWPPSTSGSAAVPTHTCPSCRQPTAPNQHHNYHHCKSDLDALRVKRGRITWFARMRGHCFLNLGIELYHRMTQRVCDPSFRRCISRILLFPGRGVSGSSSSSAAISLSFLMIWRQRSTKTSSTLAGLWVSLR